jgi:hypothetical protein
MGCGGEGEERDGAQRGGDLDHGVCPECEAEGMAGAVAPALWSSAVT